MTRDEVKKDIRAHILAEFLPGESPDALEDDTKLMSDNILDSLGSLRLVSWLDEHFGIHIEAHEIDVDNLDTLDLIANLVMAKRA